MKRRKQESGFAMLLVFLMAASIAITLYIEIPRVAFEAERQRELLLVDRGNQFKRAIQVFVTDKTNNPTRRFPASIDELENFNNHRYLRHRYIDPMTGKDEWRLIHINGGVLTDSVTTQQKPGAQNAQAGSGSGGSTYVSQQAYMDVPGGTGDGTAGVNRALQNRRPSEGAGASGDPNNPGAPVDPNNPTGAPPVAGMPPGGPGGSGVPGVPGAPPMPPGIPGQPGQPGVGGLPVTAPGTPPDQSGDASQTGQPANQPPGIGPPGMGGAPGMPGMPGAPGNGQANMSNAASQMLNNLLTTPRPGGMPNNMPGATMGGGIAGVASKYESEGIMVINQRTKINEWEYIFDPTKYRAPPNPIAGAVGTPQQPMGQGNNTNNGQGTSTSPFGSGTGTGGLTPGSPTGPTGH